MPFSRDQTFNRTFTVSEEVHGGFIRLFKDENPLHVDDRFAVERGFSGKVMHGNILNGFLSYFVGECLPLKNVIIHSQEIQYNKPVYLNDSLAFEAVVSDVHESVGAVEFKFNFRNRDAKIVSRGKIQIGILA